MRQDAMELIYRGGGAGGGDALGDARRAMEAVLAR
jgi:hypothetical protein